MAISTPVRIRRVPQAKVRIRVLPKIIPADGEAATIEIGTVTTVPAGQPATVTNVGTPEAAIFDFELPQGEDGSGAVASVNGQTGTVVLDADDIDDSATTNKFTTAAELSKLAGIESGADVTDAANVAAAGAVMEGDTSTASMSFVVDEDNMASNSATKVPTQQSVKAYVDAQNSNGPPIVLVATGQSNIENRSTYSWTPESNLYLWDFDGAVDAATDVGTAFSPMVNDEMATAFSWANEIAKKHPASSVYLLNLGKSSQPISKWMTGSPSPDCYAMVKNNVEEALDVLGLDTIDGLLWWQGESDAGSSTYLSNFNSVMTRFLAETWFPVTTPISVMGLSPYYSSNALKPINISLFNAVAAYPEVRRFINTGYLPIAYWDASGGSPYIHATGAGYERAGILAAYADRGAATAIFYEEGTWTPVLTFGTPGNLSVTYGNQAGTYTRIGRMVFASINLATSAFTHTTASGNAIISGLPYAAINDGSSQRAGGAQWQGITKANYTDIVPTVEAGNTTITLRASGSGQAAATIAAGDMPTGGSIVVRCALVYMI